LRKYKMAIAASASANSPTRRAVMDTIRVRIEDRAHTKV